MKRLAQLGAIAAAGVMVIFPAGPGAGEDEVMVQDKPASEWVKQLRSENRGLQMRAARALAEVPTNAMARMVPLLIPVLQSDRKNDRFVVAQVLGEYGPAARVVVPQLLPLLGDDQFERNRAAAAKALGQILSDAESSEEVEKVTQALIKVFDDLYVDVRREAVEACGRIGLAAKACIPHLTKRLEDVKHQPVADGSANKDVHAVAAWTAGRMGKLSVQHMDLLIMMLHKEDRNHRVSERVVTAIGCIGAVHKNVVPNVLRSLEKVIAEGSFEPIPYRIELVKAHFVTLKRLGPQAMGAGVDQMVALLSEEGIRPGREFIAVGAMDVLATIGPPAAAAAVPVIEKNYVNSKKPELKKAAEAALTALKRNQ